MTAGPGETFQAAAKEQEFSKKQDNVKIAEQLFHDLDSESTNSLKVTKATKTIKSLKTPKTPKAAKAIKVEKASKTPRTPRTPKTSKISEDSKNNKPSNPAGCLTCRQRHKKCSRSKPVCITCLKSSYLCLWREPGTRFTDYSIPLIHLDNPIGRIIKPNKGNPDSLIDSSIDINAIDDIDHVTIRNDTTYENDNSFISVAQKAVSVVNDYFNSNERLSGQSIDQAVNNKKDDDEKDADEDEDDNDKKKSQSENDSAVNDKTFFNDKKKDPDSDGSSNSNTSSSKNTNTKFSNANNARSGSSDSEKSTSSHVDIQSYTNKNNKSLSNSSDVKHSIEFERKFKINSPSKVDGDIVIEQGSKISFQPTASLEWYTKNITPLPITTFSILNQVSAMDNDVLKIGTQEYLQERPELTEKNNTSRSMNVADIVNSHASSSFQNQLQLQLRRAVTTPPSSPLTVTEKSKIPTKQTKFTANSLMRRMCKDRRIASRPTDINENIKAFEDLLTNIEPVNMEKIRNDKRRSRYKVQPKHIDVQSLPKEIAQFLNP